MTEYFVKDYTGEPFILPGASHLIALGIIVSLIGSNYLFLAHKPDTPTLLDIFGLWPWYILGMVGIGMILFLISPFAIKTWKKARCHA
jgi:uncharacterized membrane protein YwaF